MAVLEHTYPAWVDCHQVAEIARAIRPDWGGRYRGAANAARTLGRLYGRGLADRIGDGGRAFAGRERGPDGRLRPIIRFAPYRYRIIRRKENLL